MCPCTKGLSIEFLLAVTDLVCAGSGIVFENFHDMTKLAPDSDAVLSCVEPGHAKSQPLKLSLSKIQQHNEQLTSKRIRQYL